MKQFQMLLKAQVVALVTKGKCGLNTPIEKVQHLLSERYDVESTYEEVEDILIELTFDNDEHFQQEYILKIEDYLNR